MILIIVAILSVFVICNRSEAVLKQNKKIFCTYGAYDGIFLIDYIPNSYCTHLIYDYVDIDVDGNIKSFSPLLDLKGNIKIFNAQKQNKKQLKTLVIFGGSVQQQPGYYSYVFRTEENQNRFVQSSIDFIMKHNFDGLVLSWTWPGIKGGDFDEDRKNLVLILKKLKQNLITRNLLLLVHCHAYAPILKESYDVKAIAQNVDYIFLLTYSYFGSFSYNIGIATGLYTHSDEPNKALSVDSGISSWLNFGAPPEKLLMGIQMSGKLFRLENEVNTKPGSRHIGLGSNRDRITYMEYCHKFYNESWTIMWEDTQKNPYAFKGNQWVGFENEKSIEFKAKYVIEKNLAGVVTTATNNDDFRGVCGIKYPLHKVLNTYLRAIDESQAEYIVNVSVIKRNLDDMSDQCVYHSSKSF